MAKYTVRKGRRYRAVIGLTGLKRLASNETIADVLRKVGFAEVSVEGSGRTRYATALWPKADATADVPPEVEKIEELPLIAIVGRRAAHTKRKPKARAAKRRKSAKPARRKARI
jgi:hypothetical protein